MDKKEKIARLSEQHDLTLEYQEIFNRWILYLKDCSGATLWSRRSHNPEVLRDELLAYLETM